MNIRETMKQHQVCIEILEGIEYFEQCKKHHLESLKGIAGIFPDLRVRYLNKIDTYDRCIRRLWQRHDRVMRSLMEDDVIFVSSCCGAEPTGNGDNDTSDYGICAMCGDHCEYGVN